MRRRLLSTIGKPIEQLLCLPALNTLYQDVRRLSPATESGAPFLDATLERLNVTYEVSDEDRKRIPANGPAVVVANHPFGAIEGVILASLLHSVRPDFKIMANYLLSLIPEIADLFIAVDPFGRDVSLRKNIQPLKQSLRLLKDGKLLGVFPAGEVASIHLRERSVTDPPWAPTVGRIIRKTQAPVTPIYFHGANSPLFQLLGLVHPRLRTAMLPREFLRQERRTILLSVGSPIPYRKLENLKTDVDVINYLRLRTYMLKNKLSSQTKRSFPVLPPGQKSPPYLHQSDCATPVAAGPDRAALRQEIESLPAKTLLLENKEFAVYGASAQDIPLALEEIGRLRELTFRLVGEGTGKSTDLDKFDKYYDHLFVWDREQHQLVGAYRIGKTDEIISHFGVDGLYTSTLFTYKPGLFEKTGPALEMGRSFVQPEYQKCYAPLLLLWKGIGQYVLHNPLYKTLFGPVSISNDYSPLSREIMVRFLKAHMSLTTLPKLKKLVKPKYPPKLTTLKRKEARQVRSLFDSIDDVTGVITDIEKELTSIPVLLKQYLKLGGKILAFNVDPDFNEALDGLLLVDLTKTDPKILAHYMGKEESQHFIAMHQAKNG